MSDAENYRSAVGSFLLYFLVDFSILKYRVAGIILCPQKVAEFTFSSDVGAQAT